MRIADVTLLIFTFLSSARVIAYIPQIAMVLRDNTGCRAISATTWLLFLVSHVATVAYALVNLGDAMMALVFGANAICCITILGVIWWKRAAAAGRAPSSAVRVRIVHSVEPAAMQSKPEGPGLAAPLGRQDAGIGKRRRRRQRGRRFGEDVRGRDDQSPAVVT